MCVCVFILVSMGDLVPQKKFKNILFKNLWIVTGNQLKLAQVKTKILVSILKIPALPTLIMSGSKSLKCHHQSQSIFISLPCFPLDWPYFYDFVVPDGSSDLLHPLCQHSQKKIPKLKHLSELLQKNSQDYFDQSKEGLINYHGQTSIPIVHIWVMSSPLIPGVGLAPPKPRGMKVGGGRSISKESQDTILRLRRVILGMQKQHRSTQHPVLVSLHTGCKG